MKLCKDCGETKPLFEFRKSVDRCKSCAVRRYRAGGDKAYLKIVQRKKEYKFTSKCLKCGVKMLATRNNRLCIPCAWHNKQEDEADIYF